MSTQTFMPGPWWVEKHGQGIQIQTAHRGEGSSFCIAPINSWADHRDGTANLIAAAPELYEALRAVVNYEASPDFTKWKGVVNRAQAALKKAEGQL